MSHILYSQSFSEVYAVLMIQVYKSHIKVSPVPSVLLTARYVASLLSSSLGPFHFHEINIALDVNVKQLEKQTKSVQLALYTFFNLGLSMRIILTQSMAVGGLFWRIVLCTLFIFLLEIQSYTQLKNDSNREILVQRMHHLFSSLGKK